MKHVTLHGKPVTLLGRPLRVGMPAPDFRADDRELKEVRLSSFAGKAILISAFVSLDTPVCDIQVRDFNREAAALPDGVQIIGISSDLPFAQQRFCDAHAIDKELLLSDYRLSSFGINYGMLIKGLNLLARGIVVIDKSGLITHLEICPEMTGAVNLKTALAALKAAAAGSAGGKAFTHERCVPCSGGIPVISADAARTMLKDIPGWDVIDGKSISREFGFRDFAEAKGFLDLVAAIAEDQGHHPAVLLTYNKVRVTLSTHAAGGLTPNDFIVARLINEVAVS